LPEPFDGNVTGLFYRTTGSRSSNSQKLALTFASADAPKDSSAFILDIDLVQDLATQLGVTDAIEKLAELKIFEDEIFESLITDKCRDLFR
jgi:uncharacterized protein (TIGR04255 family)